MIVATGGVVSAVAVLVTVNVSVPLLPAASRAVTVMVLVPTANAIPLADQLVAPLAVPLPPAELLQLTCVTPTASEAVPESVKVVPLVEYVLPLVGEVIDTVGLVVSDVDDAPAAIPMT